MSAKQHQHGINSLFCLDANALTIWGLALAVNVIRSRVFAREQNVCAGSFTGPQEQGRSGGAITFTCSCAHTWCYGTARSLAMLQHAHLLDTKLMMGLGGAIAFTCTCAHTWCSRQDNFVTGWWSSVLQRRCKVFRTSFSTVQHSKDVFFSMARCPWLRIREGAHWGHRFLLDLADSRW